MGNPWGFESLRATGTTNVMIQDNAFTPQNVTISANGIVKWTNNGPSVHSVTSGTTPNPDGQITAILQFTGWHVDLCAIL